jgi:predicted Zn-dependent protease
MSRLLGITCLVVSGEVCVAQGAPAHRTLASVDVASKGAPSDPALRFRRAVLLSDAGRSAEALLVLQQLSEQFPDLVEPLNNQAVILAERGELHSAKQLLEQALRLDPGHVLARQNLGEVFLRLAIHTWDQLPLAQRDRAFVQRLAQVREVLAGAR